MPIFFIILKYPITSEVRHRASAKLTASLSSKYQTCKYEKKERIDEAIFPFLIPTSALVKRKGLLFSAIMSTGRICPCHSGLGKAELALAQNARQSSGKSARACKYHLQLVLATLLELFIIREVLESGFSREKLKKPG